MRIRYTYTEYSGSKAATEYSHDRALKQIYLCAILAVGVFACILALVEGGVAAVILIPILVAYGYYLFVIYNRQTEKRVQQILAEEKELYRFKTKANKDINSLKASLNGSLDNQAKFETIIRIALGNKRPEKNVELPSMNPNWFDELELYTRNLQVRGISNPYEVLFEYTLSIKDPETDMYLRAFLLNYIQKKKSKSGLAYNIQNMNDALFPN
ncbi:MAG: hypothetical protein HUJ70_13160 [Pseudobutyrivibrio sp.]|nr:hypothetical protein [Pseudobutyrivibrio sp.]